MTLDIHIKQGIGDIKFDMPVEEVVAILGKPDPVVHRHCRGRGDTVWQEGLRDGRKRDCQTDG